MFRTGTRTPEQTPSGSRQRSGDAAAQTQSQQGRELSKSSEINGAWQIGATGSTEKVRQDGGLSDVMLGASGQSQRKESRKRKARESKYENKMMWILSWIGHTKSEPYDPYGLCIKCGQVLVVNVDNIVTMTCMACHNESVYMDEMFGYDDMIYD